MVESSVTTSPSAVSLAQSPPLEAGRLTVLASLGALIGAVPLPILPDALLRRVRGAVAHDVAALRGLSLTDDARRALEDPVVTDRARQYAGEAARYFARRVLRRLGALAFVPPVAACVEIYALGLLFDRYLDKVRTSRAVRVSAEEAREARALIDRTVKNVLSFNAPFSPPAPERPVPKEELRAPLTRVVDTVLLALASVPSFFERRLLSAFDAAAAEITAGRAS